MQGTSYLAAADTADEEKLDELRAWLEWRSADNSLAALDTHSLADLHAALICAVAQIAEVLDEKINTCVAELQGIGGIELTEQDIYASRATNWEEANAPQIEALDRETTVRFLAKAREEIAWEQVEIARLAVAITCNGRALREGERESFVFYPLPRRHESAAEGRGSGQEEGEDGGVEE